MLVLSLTHAKLILQSAEALVMLGQELVRLKREHSAEDVPRERLHLLLLYRSLVRCSTSSEARVRELIQDILLHIGSSLGLVVLPPDHESTL